MNKKVKLIACEVLYDEIKDKIPVGWDLVNLERRLHNNSQDLRDKLQAEINKSQDYDKIILGYALCGKGVDGLFSEKTPLVVFKCDDCIPILLGSKKRYREQFKNEPGTYYVTREYLADVDDMMMNGFSETKGKYDEQTWKWIVSEMLKNYKRLAFINTGNYEVESLREKAKEEAEKLNLRFEEIKGKSDYLDKLVQMDFDKDFLIIGPREVIKSDMFADDEFSLDF